MAVAYYNGTGWISGNGSSITFSFSAAGSDRYVVAAGNCVNGGGHPSSATWAGTNMPALGNDGVNYFFGLVAPAAGSQNCVISYSQYSKAYYGGASFTGVDQTTPIGTFASNGGTSAAPSMGSRTAPTNGGFFASGYANYTSNGSGSGTAGNSIYIVRDGAGGRWGFAGYRIGDGAITWSIPGAAGWSVGYIPINAVPDVSLPAPPFTILQAVNRASTY